MEKRSIQIDNPPKYGVVVERGDSFEKSIFHDVYKGALRNVCDIVSGNEVFTQTQTRLEGNINTTIAFVGDRGTGKSSAMSSFASFLNDSNSIECAKGFPSDILDQIRRKKFYALPVIDSAQMGTKETILGRITAAMYKEYERLQPDTVTMEARREFIKQAKFVNDCAVNYRTGDWFKSGDALLMDSVHISDIRSEIYKLVAIYLRMISRKQDISQDYLVVSVDDIDMGIENSHAIMEEIRKFLCIQNVIVLVSLRIDQLQMILKYNFKKQIATAIADEDMPLINDLAYRYVEKLFPYSRQHHMPTLPLSDLKGIALEGGEKDESRPLLYAVLHLIWRKTLLIPVCNKEGDHLLVPRNLRTLCNMVNFLNGLQDVAYGKEKVECTYANITANDEKGSEIRNTIDNNLRAFEQYLAVNIESFERDDMYLEDIQLAGRLISVIHDIRSASLDNLNAKVVGDILMYLRQQKSKFGTACHYLADIFFSEVTSPTEGDLLLEACTVDPHAISMGDLMYVLGKIDIKSRCRYIQYLIEVIRTMWSIKMTREYFVRGVDQEYDKTCNPHITALFSQTVGGMVINPDNTQFCWIQGKATNDDWQLYKRACSGSTAFIKSDYMPLFTVYCNTKKSYNDWRIERPKGGVYYRIENEGERYIKDHGVIHPLAPLSNLLRIQDGTMPVPLSLVMKNLEIYNADFMPIPLYSLDYVYRYYEELHAHVKGSPQANLGECYRQILEFDLERFNEKCALSKYIALDSKNGFFDWSLLKKISNEAFLTFDIDSFIREYEACKKRASKSKNPHKVLLNFLKEKLTKYSDKMGVDLKKACEKAEEDQGLSYEDLQGFIEAEIAPFRG